MPKGISNLKMLDTLCEKCLKRDPRRKKEVKLFNIEFETNLVNEQMS